MRANLETAVVWSLFVCNKLSTVRQRCLPKEDEFMVSQLWQNFMIPIPSDKYQRSKHFISGDTTSVIAMPVKLLWAAIAAASAAAASAAFREMFSAASNDTWSFNELHSKFHFKDLKRVIKRTHMKNRHATLRISVFHQLIPKLNFFTSTDFFTQQMVNNSPLSSRTTCMSLCSI